jgi:TolB protein
MTDSAIVGNPAIRWITVGDEVDYWPVFSPDGDAVLFTRGSKETSLMIVSVKTGELRPFLKDPPSELTMQTRADWSRTKEATVAFAGNGGIWLAEKDGSGVRQLNGTGSMIYPSWYPDGEAMAVMYTKDNSAPQTLKISRDGAILGPLSPPDLYPGMPSVNQRSPQSIVYPGQIADGAYDQNNNQIWITTISGETARRMEMAQGRQPWWSPDGRLIAFMSTRSGAAAMYVAPPDGSVVLRLTDPAIVAQHPKWSPDGERIVFAGKPRADGPTKIGILSPGDVPRFRCLFG